MHRDEGAAGGLVDAKFGKEVPNVDPRRSEHASKLVDNAMLDRHGGSRLRSSDRL